MATTTPAPIACEAPVFFTTTEGQTRRIADRLAAVLREAGLDSQPIDMAQGAGAIDWSRVRVALVGASIHVGTHQPAAVSFVDRHAARLNAIPSVFFSVSLSAASSHQDEVAAASRIADAFPPAHGWTPAVVASLAGRLAYTRYGFLKRMVMKRIARKEGAPTDTSRDYDLTDWDMVERLGRDVAALVRDLEARPPQRQRTREGSAAGDMDSGSGRRIRPPTGRGAAGGSRSPGSATSRAWVGVRETRR